MIGLIKKIIPTGLKRRIGRSRLFWSLRSKFLGDSVWMGYKNSYKDKRRGFYSDFVNKNRCVTILDFGCASGPNLIRIEKDLPTQKFFFLGIDVSSDALRIARAEISSEAVFEQTLTPTSFSRLANLNREGTVDLAIFDRVLTCMTEQELVKTLELISLKCKYIIIDDFFAQKEFQGPVWLARDYENILFQYGYELREKQTSGHKTTSDFHNDHAFLAVFSKTINSTN